jgi:lambda repressor-like predicted transcriptional regulator
MITQTCSPKKGHKPDGNAIASRMFAQVFQAYLECSDEVQQAVRAMVDVVNSPDATQEECEAALITIQDALFPATHDGELGVGLEEAERLAADKFKDVRSAVEQLDQQEATFADRVSDLLEAKGMTQGDLAAEIGVKQPAISMMLSRNCRPQRRTIEKIAEALKVAPEAIWPGFNDD